MTFHPVFLVTYRSLVSLDLLQASLPFSIHKAMRNLLPIRHSPWWSLWVWETWAFHLWISLVDFRRPKQFYPRPRLGVEVWISRGSDLAWKLSASACKAKRSWLSWWLHPQSRKANMENQFPSGETHGVDTYKYRLFLTCCWMLERLPWKSWWICLLATSSTGDTWQEISVFEASTSTTWMSHTQTWIGKIW